MEYLANPDISDYKEGERLTLIALNKSVYQNMYSFLRLNDSNMQYAAFACLEYAVYAIRLFSALFSYPEYMQSYLTDSDFDLELCEKEIEEKENAKEYDKNKEPFLPSAFGKAIRWFNTFELKNPAVSSQLNDGQVYLGLSCGSPVSEELQHEVRKNVIGAYMSLVRHTSLFVNDGADPELEKLEKALFARLMDYVKRYS